MQESGAQTPEQKVGEFIAGELAGLTSFRKAPVGLGSLWKPSMISFQVQQTYTSSCPLC